MPTLFSRIIAGELPARFVYRDDRTVAFLTIAPVRPGHTLVVPVAEVDDWLDLTAADLAALTATSRIVGAAIRQVFRPRRVAAVLLGLEVPHCHLHLIPIDSEAQLDFALADHNPDPAELDDIAARIEAAVRAG